MKHGTKTLNPYPEKSVSAAMAHIISYFDRMEGTKNFIDKSFLSHHGLCIEGDEMPFLNYLCSRGYISYTSEGNYGRDRIILQPCGRTYFEDLAAQKEKQRIDERRFRIPVVISIVALIVSIVSLIRTW